MFTKYRKAKTIQHRIHPRVADRLFDMRDKLRKAEEATAVKIPTLIGTDSTINRTSGSPARIAFRSKYK